MHKVLTTGGRNIGALEKILSIVAATVCCPSLKKTELETVWLEADPNMPQEKIDDLVESAKLYGINLCFSMSYQRAVELSSIIQDSILEYDLRDLQVDEPIIISQAGGKRKKSKDWEGRRSW